MIGNSIPPPKKWCIAILTLTKKKAHYNPDAIHKMAHYNLDVGQEKAHYNVDAGQNVPQNLEENCNFLAILKVKV